MWKDLTLSDKARMIQLAVKSGITDLNTIHQVYNTFANGGNLDGDPPYSVRGKVGDLEGKSLHYIIENLIEHPATTIQLLRERNAKRRENKSPEFGGGKFRGAGAGGYWNEETLTGALDRMEEEKMKDKIIYTPGPTATSTQKKSFGQIFREHKNAGDKGFWLDGVYYTTEEDPNAKIGKPRYHSVSVSTPTVTREVENSEGKILSDSTATSFYSGQRMGKFDRKEDPNAAANRLNGLPFYNGEIGFSGIKAFGGPLKAFTDPIKENQFQDWYKKYATSHNVNSNPDDKKHYYDYRAYWENTGAFDREAAASSNGHLPDTYKLPGHPTFSNESIYASKKKNEPKWDVKYTPMPEPYLRKETTQERIDRVNGVKPKQTVDYSNKQNDQEFVLKDIMARIYATENSKDSVKGGYNKKEDRWYPVDSPEGGRQTVAYGIKLGTGSPEALLAEKQGYLTGKQADDAVRSLALTHMDTAKRIYDKKFGVGSWDTLSGKSQSILTDYSFNVGLQKFPKLMEGFNEGNLKKIKDNYKRYTGGKPLTGRNNYIRKDIDSLMTYYPILK